MRRILFITFALPIIMSGIVWLITKRRVKLIDLCGFTLVFSNLGLNLGWLMVKGSVLALKTQYGNTFIAACALLSLVVAILSYFIILDLNRRQKTFKIARFTTWFLLTLGIGAFIYVDWVVKSNGQFNFEILLFNLMMPVNTDTGNFLPDITRVLSGPLSIGLGLALIIFGSSIVKPIRPDSRKNESVSMKVTRIGMPIVLVVAVFIYSFVSLDVKNLIAYYTQEEPFIGDHYIDASEDTITFPENKRNLVFIFVESLEATYFDKENGGWKDYNLLPNMTRRIKENKAISFSHNADTLGGMQNAPGTSWSIAGMISQLSGVPQKMPVDVGTYEPGTPFLPGVVTVGEILQSQGYRNAFLEGLYANVFGIGTFYSQHGDHEVYDYGYFEWQKLIPEDFKGFQGVDDERLYKQAKVLMEEYSATDQPFNIVVETADTHFPDGFVNSACPSNYNEPYANSIACADQMLEEFISWIEQQPFYENTTIVVTGDHLSMDGTYFQNIGDYNRTVFNMIINPDPSVDTNVNQFNRTFYAMDMYPTILRSLGYTIKDDRLGLGTDLFSGKPTLYEELGMKPVSDALAKQSKFYNEHFIYRINEWNK